MAEQIVTAVLGAVTAVAAVAPWAWNRRGGLRGSIAERLIISLLATTAVACACLWTQADARTRTITASGEHAICGGGYLYMPDSRLERTEGFPHECIVQSRIAVAVILSVVVATIVLAGRWRLLRSFVPYCTRRRSVVRDKGA